MKERNIILFVLVGMLLSLVGLGGASYSLYKSSPRGKTSGAIANWSFSVNGSRDTFAIDLATNARNTLNGKLTPGSYGSFDINLDASSTDMDVNYMITFSNLKGKPANLNFYLDKNYVTEIDLVSTKIDGVIKYSDKMIKTVTVYWEWEYDGDDNFDQGSVMSFNINVVGSQVI